MDTKRIEAFADGVFAIAMTLLVIEIHVPEVPAGSSLAAALLHLAPNVIAYAVSFVILGTLWVGHHAQFHYIKRVHRPLRWIDIHFLLFIAFLPFSTALLAEHYREPLAATIYGATLLGAGVFLYWHWHHATSGHRLVDPSLQEPMVRTVKRRVLGVSSFVTSGNITPLFSVNHHGVAEIVMKGSGSGYELSSTRTAVSGFSRPLNKGATAGDTVTLHPRTGIGLSTNGQYAYFMTVDGRASEWSEGATEREVGEWLQFFGAYNGVNMDGGGSTTMAWWNPAGSGSSELLNVPRDSSTSFGNSPAAQERYVGNSIGVYYSQDPVMRVTGNSVIVSDGDAGGIREIPGQHRCTSNPGVAGDSGSG